jgi:hypothetical protein
MKHKSILVLRRLIVVTTFLAAEYIVDLHSIPRERLVLAKR